MTDALHRIGDSLFVYNTASAKAHLDSKPLRNQAF